MFYCLSLDRKHQLEKHPVSGKAAKKLWKSCGKAVEKLWKSCGKA